MLHHTHRPPRMFANPGAASFHTINLFNGFGDRGDARFQVMLFSIIELSHLSIDCRISQSVTRILSTLVMFLSHIECRRLSSSESFFSGAVVHFMSIHFDPAPFDMQTLYSLEYLRSSTLSTHRSSLSLFVCIHPLMTALATNLLAHLLSKSACLNPRCYFKSSVLPLLSQHR
jgi:hypothetical protein